MNRKTGLHKVTRVTTKNKLVREFFKTIPNASIVEEWISDEDGTFSRKLTEFFSIEDFEGRE